MLGSIDLIVPSLTSFCQDRASIQGVVTGTSAAVSLQVSCICIRVNCPLRSGNLSVPTGILNLNFSVWTLSNSDNSAVAADLRDANKLTTSLKNQRVPSLYNVSVLDAVALAVAMAAADVSTSSTLTIVIAAIGAPLVAGILFLAVLLFLFHRSKMVLEKQFGLLPEEQVYGARCEKLGAPKEDSSVGNVASNNVEQCNEVEIPIHPPATETYALTIESATTLTHPHVVSPESLEDIASNSRKEEKTEVSKDEAVASSPLRSQDDDLTELPPPSTSSKEGHRERRRGKRDGGRERDREYDESYKSPRQEGPKELPAQKVSAPPSGSDAAHRPFSNLKHAPEIKQSKEALDASSPLPLPTLKTSGESAGQLQKKTGQRFAQERDANDGSASPCSRGWTSRHAKGYTFAS